MPIWIVRCSELAGVGALGAKPPPEAAGPGPKYGGGVGGTMRGEKPSCSSNAAWKPGSKPPIGDSTRSGAPVGV